MSNKRKQEQEEAVKNLKGFLKPGDEIHTVLRHVSRSGMYRVIDVYFFLAEKNRNKDREINGIQVRQSEGKEKLIYNKRAYVAIPLRISWDVSRACGFKYDRRHEGVGVGGCGMDMGFHVVYELGHYLFGNGYWLVHKWM